MIVSISSTLLQPYALLLTQWLNGQVQDIIAEVPRDINHSNLRTYIEKTYNVQLPNSFRPGQTIFI